MPTRVIIADAVTAIREMTARIITAEGYEVVGQADDGHDALRLCQSLHPHLILLELTLGGLTGHEVLRQLRAQRDPVQILIFSSTRDPEVVRQVLNERPDGFVSKNEPLESLLEGLRTLATGRVYLTSSIAAQWKSAREESDIRLTARELEIVQLVARSLSSKEIAARLGLALKTVENHRARLMEKLQSRNAAGLIRYAIQHGLISFD